MNKILEDVIKKRNGHYCHVIEVDNVYSLKSVIESLYDEFIDEYSNDEVIEFISSIQIIYFNADGENDEDEKAVNDFDLEDYLNSF